MYSEVKGARTLPLRPDRRKFWHLYRLNFKKPSFSKQTAFRRLVLVVEATRGPVAMATACVRRTPCHGRSSRRRLCPLEHSLFCILFSVSPIYLSYLYVWILIRRYPSVNFCAWFNECASFTLLPYVCINTARINIHLHNY